MNKMFGDRKLYSITDSLPVIADVLEAGIDKQVSHVYLELWPHVGMKRKCYEVNIEESEKASSHRETNPGKLTCAARWD